MLKRICVCLGLAAAVLVSGCSSVGKPSQLWPAEPVDKPSSVAPVDALQAQWQQEASSAMQAQDWYTAIDIAERGIRFNRREPVWYLVMAESYLALAEWQQAESFARQGQRFSGPDLAPRFAAVISKATAPH